MYLPDVEFHDPLTLEEAASLMARYAPHARLLAGGTDLLVDLKTGRSIVEHVISLTGIDALHGISLTDKGLRVGALVTPNELSESQIVRERFSPLLDATRELAAHQIRNMATVGGNIAGAIPSADMPPILMVMNATVVLWSPKDERTVPVESVFVGPRQTSLGKNEILTSIRVPFPPLRFGAGFARFAQRRANSCAIAGVAASLHLGDDGKILGARLALSAVAPTPKLVNGIGELLSGRVPDESAFHEAATIAAEAAVPITDVRGSADYRSRIVAVLAMRALTTARTRAEEWGR